MYFLLTTGFTALTPLLCPRLLCYAIQTTRAYSVSRAANFESYLKNCKRGLWSEYALSFSLCDFLLALGSGKVLVVEVAQSLKI
jgi:hypothetical protein